MHIRHAHTHMHALDAMVTQVHIPHVYTLACTCTCTHVYTPTCTCMHMYVYAEADQQLVSAIVYPCTIYLTSLIALFVDLA